MNAFIPQRDLPRQLLAALSGGFALFIGIVLVWTIGYQLAYAGRIFPGVSVAGVDLSGLSPGEAAVKLSQTLSYPNTGKLLFRDGERVWVASPAELGMVFDPTASANAAYEHGRKGGMFTALSRQISARGLGADVAPVVIFDQRVAYAYLQNLAVQVDQPLAEAVLRLEGTNVISEPGRVGRSLNLDATLIYLGSQLQSFRDGEVPLVIQETTPRLLDVNAQADLARTMLSQPFTVTLPNTGSNDPGPWTFDVNVLVNMLAFNMINSGGVPQLPVGLDANALRKSLSDLKVLVDRTPKEPRFVFDEDRGQMKPISEFFRWACHGCGSEYRHNQWSIMQRGEHSVNLVVAEQQPAVTDQPNSAELEIIQLVASQTTYFYGSSEARIQNIVTAASQYHGLLVAYRSNIFHGECAG